MIAVATTEDELAGVCNRLRALGARPVEVVAPSDTRRVVLAAVDDERRVAGLVVSLRAEGAMAVIRGPTEVLHSRRGIGTLAPSRSANDSASASHGQSTIAGISRR